MQLSVRRMSDPETTLEASDEVEKKSGHVKISYQTRLDCFSSLSSIYSADGGQANYHISGSILLGIWHRNDTLFVRVVKAKDLAGAKAGGLSDPYVKTNILPDSSKLTKRKTTIDRKTNNPTYNEILKTRLSRFAINKSTLWVTVWDYDKFGSNLFLGEVRLKLYSIDLTDMEGETWYKLREKKDDPVKEDRGSITFSVKYSPYKTSSKGSLFVKILQAKGLPKMNPIGLTDASVRIFLLPNRTPLTKQKTKVAKNTLNPIWNEEFEYKYITLEELKTSHVLELTLWDYDRRGCNDFIGCVRLGPRPDESNAMHNEWMDSTDTESEDWARVLANPDQWVDVCHELRSSLACRFEIPAHLRDDDLELSDHEDEDSDEENSTYGSKTSLYSECEMKGDFPVTGGLEVKLEHDKDILAVHILSAKDLAAADDTGLSDPYVKLYLLPKSKHSKRKTSIKLQTLNPIFKEVKEYEIEADQLFSHSLWFSVWDWDKFGKNLFLGEVQVPLSKANINAPAQFYDLSDSTNMESSPMKVFVGKLTIGLKFQPLGSSFGEIHGNLHIHIRNATKLLNADDDYYTDGFVKIFLLPSKSFKSQRKTKIIKDDINPAWNENFVYKNVTFEQLSSSHTLEISVWDHNSIWSNEFIGGLRIGPAPKPNQTKEWMDSTSMESGHWEEMLSCPDQWVEHCHMLRPTMEYRNVSLLVKRSVSSSPVQEKIEEVVASTHSEDEENSALTDASSEPQCSSARASSEEIDVQSQTEVSHSEVETADVAALESPDSQVQLPVPLTTADEPSKEESEDSTASTDDGDSVFLPAATDPKVYLLSGPFSEPGHHRGSLDSSKQRRSRIRSPIFHSIQSHRSASLAVPPQHEQEEENLFGYLVLSLKFEVSSKKRKTKGYLYAKLQEAQQLQCKTGDGIFARCCMLPLGFFSSIKRTKTIKNSKNPIWDETFNLGKHNLEDISTEKVFEVALWDINDISNPLFAGGVRIGPDPKKMSETVAWMDSTVTEAGHWEAIFATPGKWVVYKHALRATLNY